MALMRPVIMSPVQLFMHASQCQCQSSLHRGCQNAAMCIVDCAETGNNVPSSTVHTNPFKKNLLSKNIKYHKNALKRQINIHFSLEDS